MPTVIDFERLKVRNLCNSRVMKFRYAAVAGHPVEPKDVKGARGPNIRIDVKELEDVLHKLGIFPELHKTPTDA